MNSERCNNQNHSKMNVVIRHCPKCGEIVNRKIRSHPCDNEVHIKGRKNGNHFCVDCGNNLKSPS